MNQLSETARDRWLEPLLRLHQIIGQDAVTQEQAEQNRRSGKGPKRPRSAIPPIIPVRKSCWWDGVKTGRFPKPVKIGNGRGSFWRAEQIRALVESEDA